MEQRSLIEAPPESVAARFGRALGVAAERARALGTPVLTSVSTPLSPVDPITLFERAGRAGLTHRTVWTRPEDAITIVGLGSAWERTSGGGDRFGRLNAAWGELTAKSAGHGDDTAAQPWGTGPVALYGFAFAPDGPSGAAWEGYPNAAILLPRLSAVITPDASRLTLSAVVDPVGHAAAAALAEAEAYLDLCAETSGAQTHGDDPPGGARWSRASGLPAGSGLRVVEESPAAADWRTAVGAAAAAVRRGALAKVVLARALRVRDAGLPRRGQIDAARALRMLRRDYPACTVFAVARADRCFLGATPERLVRLRDGMVTTGAVAGSWARGATEDEDRREEQRLVHSRKDRIEHAVVVEAITEALAGLCDGIEAGKAPDVLTMRNVRHLSTPITARLRGRRTVLELAERLHPTPAVGGVPQDAALRWIREREGWDRGWYAGTVGWMDRAGDGEAAVAIRSAAVRGDEAWLFAGCGIVAGSDPDSEYTESMLKLRPMLGALGD